MCKNLLFFVLLWKLLLLLIYCSKTINRLRAAVEIIHSWPRANCGFSLLTISYEKVVSENRVKMHIWKLCSILRKTTYGASFCFFVFWGISVYQKAARRDSESHYSSVCMYWRTLTTLADFKARQYLFDDISFHSLYRELTVLWTESWELVPKVVSPVSAFPVSPVHPGVGLADSDSDTQLSSSHKQQPQD